VQVQVYKFYVLEVYQGTFSLKVVDRNWQFLSVLVD